MSLRDDLESLGYTILSILCDKKDFWFESVLNEHKYYAAEKKKFIEDKSIGSKYKPSQTYLKEV